MTSPSLHLKISLLKYNHQIENKLNAKVMNTKIMNTIPKIINSKVIKKIKELAIEMKEAQNRDANARAT